MKQNLILSTVGKAFALLELVGTCKSGYTLTELVRRLNLSVGATQRLTNTLVVLNYLYKEANTKVYRLTPKIYHFGFAFLNQSEVREIALPYMRHLNEKTDEVINLGVMISDEEMVYIERIDKTSHALTTNIRVGTRRPIHLYSIGRTILAFLDERDQRRILGHVFTTNPRGKALSDKIELIEKLRKTRKNGYYSNVEDMAADFWGIAVPLLNHQGVPIAAINISIPKGRIPPKRIHKEYLPLLIQAGEAISQALGRMQ